MKKTEETTVVERTALERSVGMLVIGGIALVGLLISPSALDQLRTPKTLAMRAIAIVLAAVWASAAILGSMPDWRDRVRRWRHVLILVGAIIGWTVLTSITSTNRPLSAGATWVAVAEAIFFLSALYAIENERQRNGKQWVLIVLIATAVINSAVSLLQTFDVWQPLHFSRFAARSSLARAALIGNPNDVGCYLMGPALAATGLALIVRTRKSRIAAISLASFLFVALLVNQTRTTLLAYLVGVATFAIVRASRRALVALGGLMLVIVLAFTLAPHLFRRSISMHDLSVREVDRALSGRLISFASAWEIFLDHPLMGSGPGTFGYQYMPYRLRAEHRYPALRTVLNRGINFGQVHNDHLEVLAETGIPGYLMMLAAIAMVAAGSMRVLRRRWARAPAPDDGSPPPGVAFAESFALPLAVSFFVMTLAQFPMQLTAPTMVYLVLAAHSLVWTRR